MMFGNLGQTVMKRTVNTEFEIDSTRAQKIAATLFDQFYNHKGFFTGYVMPEYIPPKNLKLGTKEHAQYLTYVISIDYMTDASKLWKNSRAAYEKYPERFTPEKILKFSPGPVEEFVKKLGARYYSNAAKSGIKISQVLLDKYDGDPRNITPQPLEIAEIKKQLKLFPYLRGNKLSNFYIRVMGDRGLFKVKNLNELDIPVDQQVARFTIYSGVLQLISNQFVGCAQEEPLRGLIEEAWREAAKTLGTAPWKLDQPIWTLGSQLCSARKCSKCPVESMCNKSKGAIFKQNTIAWRKE